MSLYQDWKDLMDAQTEESFDTFWKEYSETETKIYTHILSNYKEHLKGKVSALVEQFECDKTIFVGFLDGINSSLNNALDLDKVKETTSIDLDIDFEKLFYNMLVAEADYLFTLEQWEEVLTQEKRIEIIKEFKQSRTVHVEKKPGRNDPCPCGSGKKYKKCCGRS